MDLFPTTYPEPFPDCEQILLDAFKSADPVRAVLDLLQTYPSDPTVDEVVAVYAMTVESAPTRADYYAKVLSDICESPDGPVMYGTETVSDLMSARLADFHNAAFTFTSQCKFAPESLGQDSKVYGPTNQYLITSLLSGFTFKYHLSRCSGQFGGIGDGLGTGDYSVSVKDDPSLCQLQVVGTCMQLLIYGSWLATNKTQPCLEPIEEIAAKLKAQKAAGAVTDPNALKVLELAILHAESGFKEENDMTNVWDLLFPSTLSA